MRLVYCVQCWSKTYFWVNRVLRFKASQTEIITKMLYYLCGGGMKSCGEVLELHRYSASSCASTRFSFLSASTTLLSRSDSFTSFKRSNSDDTRDSRSRSEYASPTDA